jgi:endonuclease-8
MIAPHRRHGLPPRLYTHSFAPGSRLRVVLLPIERLSVCVRDMTFAAGIGNVFKSEILFLAGLDPFTPVAALPDAALERLVDIAREQLAANVLSRSQTLSRSVGRRTTRSLDPNAKLWVYGRGGKPCRRCGTRIESRKTGLDARLTYWCPQCQPPLRGGS